MTETNQLNQTRNVAKHVNEAIKGLEEHDDVEGALAKLRWISRSMDGITAGVEFEEFLTELGEETKTIERIEVSDDRVEIETRSEFLEGDFVTGLLEELPEGVFVHGIASYNDRGQMMVKLGYPEAWPVENGKMYSDEGLGDLFR